MTAFFADNKYSSQSQHLG